MSGGTQSTKTENKPWDGTAGSLVGANEQLMKGYSQAYEAGPTPQSQATQRGQAALWNTAVNPNSLLNQSLGLAGQTVNGDFLSAGNPYFQQAYQGAADQATRAYNSAVDPSMRQYQSQMTGNLQNYQTQLEGNQQNYQSQMDSNLSQWKNAISPGIDAQFAMGGRLGSGLFANARNEGETNTARQFNDAQSNTARAFGSAQSNMARSFGDAQSNQAQYLADSNDALARNLTNTAGSMAYQNYGDERNRQNAAMSTAPGLSTLPGGIMQQVGQQQQDDETARRQFQFNLAQQYGQAASGLNGGGYGVSTGKQPGQSPWLQALGLGMQGAAMFI